LSSAHGVPTAATLPATNESALERADIQRVNAEPGQLGLDAIPLPGAASDGAEPMVASRSWLEVLAMTSIPPLATAWLAPDDPLLLGGHFPWLVLLPLLVGVQHGALAAALSSGLLVAAGALHGALGGPMPAAALAAFAGGCVSAGVIAGHSRDRVQARLLRLSREARQGAERLARLGRAHAMVKLSHQRLEERLAAHSWSLVGAFEDARRTLASQSSLASVGEVVLHVLSNHALVQSATLLTLARDERGRVGLEARARIGNPPPFDTAHPLVQRSLDTGRLVALDAESADGGAEQDLLAVAPLGTASGRLLGLVLIHEMPFMAFQAENLKGLAALTALLADMLEDRFVEAHADAGLHLSLPTPESLPTLEPAPQAASTPASSPRPKAERSNERQGDERPTEEWLEDELAASEAEPEGAPEGDDFVGTRTGTHRRRGVAQSA
jgi:hypothetical protein